MFELTQIVERPTRATRTSKTLIDHIITNHSQRVTNTGIIPCSIVSDHDVIYTCVNLRPSWFHPCYKFIRDFRNFNEDMFKEDFSTLPLSVIYYLDDPDEQLETLNTLISECLETHAPLRKVRATGPPAPWMKDPLMEELQRKRDSARFTAHQTSTDAAWHEFHLVRNKLKSAIRTAQEAFIEKALYSNKSHEVWKVIQRGLKPSARPLRFDPDELNDFFTTTAQRTLETQVTPIEDLTCLIDNLPDVPSEGMRFQLSPVTSENVLKVIKNLLLDCSTGTDQILTRFIKIVAECLTVPLTSIINKYIAKAYFPKQWKIAQVSPVPKIDDPVSNNQLQPISVLPVLSKVFKKLVAIQMTTYADHAHLLDNRISAFCKRHSTTTALLRVRDNICCAMKRKEFMLMVLANFSKAFDTISFSATIMKFYKLGFLKPFLKWLLSYLSRRSQFVQINNRNSSNQSSQYSIPQGSILGPMIFNL